MATLEKRGGSYRLIYHYLGKRFQQQLKAESEKEAEQLKTVLERNLDLLHQGVLFPPEGADLGLFLLSSGNATELPTAEKPATLGDLLDQYEAMRPRSTRTAPPAGLQAQERRSRSSGEIKKRHTIGRDECRPIAPSDW